MNLTFSKGIKFIISLSLMVLSSCSKNDSTTEIVNPDVDGTYIKINMMGIIDIDQTKLASRHNNQFDKLASINSLSGDSQSADNMISVGNSLDALTSVSTIDFKSINNAVETFNGSDYFNGQPNNLKSLSKDQVTNKLASTVKPLDGQAFRIILFDDDKIINLDNSIYSSRQAPVIQVEPNKVYRWVVVSTDESEIPEITEDGKILKNNLGNKNILYASGTIATKEGENPIQVILKHHRVRYDVMVDARGVFGSIKSDSEIAIGYMEAANFHSIIEHGDLDLLTGEYTNVETVDHIALGSMMRDTLTSDGSVKKYSFYTISKKPVVENSLTLKFKKFGIEVSSPTPANAENKATREFDNNRLATFSHEAYSHNYNGYYDVNIRLVDVGMPVEGLIWARTNLIQDENGNYVFRSNNDFKGELTKDYWNFKAINTGRFERESSEDPCAKVYPHNVWRTPYKNDFDKLIEGKRDILEKNGLFYGKRYVMTWKLDGNSTIDDGYVEANNIDNSNNTLSLIFGGYRNNAKNSLERSPFGLGQLFSLGQAHYWSRDADKNESEKAYMLYGGIFEFLGIEFLNSKTESGNTDVGRFIRCVRDTKTN